MADRRAGELRPILDTTPNWAARLPRLLEQWKANGRETLQHSEAFAALNKMATEADSGNRMAAMLRSQQQQMVEIEAGNGSDHLRAVIARQEQTIVKLKAELAERAGREVE